MLLGFHLGAQIRLTLTLGLLGLQLLRQSLLFALGILLGLELGLLLGLAYRLGFAFGFELGCGTRLLRGLPLCLLRLPRRLRRAGCFRCTGRLCGDLGRGLGRGGTLGGFLFRLPLGLLARERSRIDGGWVGAVAWVGGALCTTVAWIARDCGAGLGWWYCHHPQNSAPTMAACTSTDSEMDSTRSLLGALLVIVIGPARSGYRSGRRRLRRRLCLKSHAAGPCLL